jgi:predicted nucleic acid-binding Zn ribbon protein
VRRVAPRPASHVFERVLASLAPATTLARVQSLWREVVGEALADEAQPVSERAGVVTVACSSSVWAQELALLGPELAGRLNEALAEDGGRAAVAELRFQVGMPAGG